MDHPTPEDIALVADALPSRPLTETEISLKVHLHYWVQRTMKPRPWERTRPEATIAKVKRVQEALAANDVRLAVRISEEKP